jgi:hypothetical protein
MPRARTLPHQTASAEGSQVRRKSEKRVKGCSHIDSSMFFLRAVCMRGKVAVRRKNARKAHVSLKKREPFYIVAVMLLYGRNCSYISYESQDMLVR